MWASLFQSPLVKTRPSLCSFLQKRGAASDIRPKRVKYKKAQQGFYPSRSGGSIRGTTVFLGDYGLQTIEGGRISDTHLDVARHGIRRALKNEKGSQWFMRCFPDRPVTGKPSEVRMGKGKGYVDYYATWLAEGRMIFEVKDCRPELAIKALKIAGSFIPLRTRIVEKNQDMRVAPRVLPHFVRSRLAMMEKDDAIAVLPPTTALSAAAKPGPDSSQ
ncbi:hypothetical protein HDV03_000874 [Kappamyces sp. JEL0829]|nr:hypothetical protein HDV03_000874 [Kappamyces sp. JEL0829]